MALKTKGNPFWLVWGEKDTSGMNDPVLEVYSLGIVLKVGWVQETLHLLTVGKHRPQNVTKRRNVYPLRSLLSKVRADRKPDCRALTWGWPSHWHAGRLDGRSAARTLWGRATRASPAGRRGVMRESKMWRAQEGERRNHLRSAFV